MAAAFVVTVLAIVLLALSPVPSAAWLVAAASGAVLTGAATGLGGGRAMVLVWHEALVDGHVMRHLVGVARGEPQAAELMKGAAAAYAPGLPGEFTREPITVGPLEAEEVIRLLIRRRRPRLSTSVGSTVWLVSDADLPEVAPGRSVLGVAADEPSAESLVIARRGESLVGADRVRAVPVVTDTLLVEAPPRAVAGSWLAQVVVNGFPARSR